MHSASGHYAEMTNTKRLREIVGTNAKLLREAKKMSQPDVAKAAKRHGIKIDQTTVGRIERAVIPTTLDRLHALSLGLGVKPWHLLVEGLDPKRLPKDGHNGHASAVDRELMLTTLTGVRRFLTDHPDVDAELDDEMRAKLIEALYDHYAVNGTADQAAVERYLRLVAK
jgi:transcriptional regulator with XRE-family HTH domain